MVDGVECLLCGASTDHMNLVTEELRDGPGRVYRCEACDLEMLDPGDRISATMYEGDYRKTHGPELGKETTPEETFEAYREAQDARVNLLIPYAHHGARLLEVGCSSGMFLDAIRQTVREAVGLDLDKESARYAARATGCPVFESWLSLANWVNERTSIDGAQYGFDVICAFQTLEHVEDPYVFLECLKPFLAPNGVVVIEVPSVNDPLLTLYEIPEYMSFFYHRAHNWYFSPESLATLMEDAGFDGHIEYVQDYNFLNHLSWAYTRKPQPSCRPGLGVPELPVPGRTLVRADLLHWAEKADIEYKQLLSQHGYTENVTFIGRLSREAEVNPCST